MTIRTEEQARAEGFTRHIIWDDDGGFVGDALVKPDAELDGEFPAFCLEEHEMITLHGWALFVEDAT